jgi:hypothetical protein
VKPLLAMKITRETKDGLGDYTAAKDQATLDGLRDFEQRQRQRIADAQKDRDEAQRVVRPMARKAK